MISAAFALAKGKQISTMLARTDQKVSLQKTAELGHRGRADETGLVFFVFKEWNPEIQLAGNKLTLRRIDSKANPEPIHQRPAGRHRLQLNLRNLAGAHLDSRKALDDETFIRTGPKTQMGL